MSFGVSRWKYKKKTNSYTKTMDCNLTSYLRLKKTAVKDEDDEPDETTEYFQWTPESTKLMLKLRFQVDRHQQFENRTHQRKELWDEIATEMFRQGGYKITGEVCDMKYRNMLQTYKKNRNKELHGSSLSSISWHYYDIFRAGLENDNDLQSPDIEQPNDSNQSDHNINGNSSKIQKLDIKPELLEIPVTPMVQLRAPSARISNKRQHNSLPHYPLNLYNEPICKVKPALQIEHSTQKSAVLKAASSNHLNTLSTFEVEECRVFGETVGVQLSLIKSSEIRALAELKIQEILYRAKISKLKE